VDQFSADWVDHFVADLVVQFARILHATDIHASVPINVFGSQMAATGDAYCGIVSYHIFNDWNEMVGRKLSTTLVPGTKYYVSVKFSLADNSPCAINKLGVLFTTQSYCDSLDIYNICYSPEMPIPNFAHIYSSKIITDTVGWTTVAGSYIADSAYQFIVIGNLYDYANTNDSLLYGNTSCNGGYVYYYIDDVCISTDSLLCNPLDAIYENSLNNKGNVFPNPATNELTVDFDLTDKGYFELYDLIGAKRKNVSFDSGTLTKRIDLTGIDSGLYFYSVVDMKGNRIKTGKLIVIK